MGSVKRARVVQVAANPPLWSAGKANGEEMLLRTSIVTSSGTTVTIGKRGQKRARGNYELRNTVLSSKSYRDVEEAVLPSASPLDKIICPTPADASRPGLDDLQTIVINLDHRPDRMATVGKDLKAACSKLPFSRFSASNGSKMPIDSSEVTHSWNTSQNNQYQRLRSIRKGWNDLDTYVDCNLKMSGGERGCASSHVRAWRHCLEKASASGQENRPLLVLEDDAQPTPEFAATLQRALTDLPKDAHVLYLGYSQAAEWRRELTKDLVESEYVWTTVGYIIWPAGAQILLSSLPVNAPVDNFMAGKCADRELKAFCVRPKIIRQAEGWNVNSDVAHSDENSWDPDMYEPLLLVGSTNNWNANEAKTSHKFEHINADDTSAQSKESRLRLKCDGATMSFQVISARKLRDFRLYPNESLEGGCLMVDDSALKEACLMVGKDHSLAAGKNFSFDSSKFTDGSVTLRVSQNRDQFRVWLEQDFQ